MNGRTDRRDCMRATLMLCALRMRFSRTNSSARRINYAPLSNPCVCASSPLSCSPVFAQSYFLHRRSTQQRLSTPRNVRRSRLAVCQLSLPPREYVCLCLLVCACVRVCIVAALFWLVVVSLSTAALSVLEMCASLYEFQSNQTPQVRRSRPILASFSSLANARARATMIYNLKSPSDVCWLTD